MTLLKEDLDKLTDITPRTVARMIIKRLKKMNMTEYKLCELIGMKPSQMYGMLHYEGVKKIKTLSTIYKAFQDYNKS